MLCQGPIWGSQARKHAISEKQDTQSLSSASILSFIGLSRLILCVTKWHSFLIKNSVPAIEYEYATSTIKLKKSWHKEHQKFYCNFFINLL
jgi:kynurenine formamidase